MQNTFPACMIVPILLLGLTACPGSLEDREQFEKGNGTSATAETTSSSVCDPAPIFAKSCASCHSSASPLGGLALDTPQALEALKGKAAQGGKGTLVDPASPTTSVLYTKLNAPPPFGAVMPPSGDLSADDKQCILRWAGGPEKEGSP